MCVLEGQLEKKRRDLALRTDFNLCDTYKLFLNLQMGKPGIDCDDVYAAITQNLEVDISKDEVFIIFYKVDKDGDGYWSYDELQQAFVPRENEYAILVNSRGGFYGGESNLKHYFEGETRNTLKKFIRALCECEISVELIRQKISNKLQIKPEAAFKAVDKDDKGYLSVNDLREFIKSQNMYPIEKNLGLLFERFNKSEDGAISYEEFVAGITPFLSGIKQAE
jgi:Ca2+-binding EF-hand superfamily protein